MNSKRLFQMLMVGGGLILSIVAVFSILLNPTGGISGLSKLVTILGFFLGILNPRAALFFLIVQATYSDEIKRIGVFYGVQSNETVSEILIGPLLTLFAINLSFLHGVLRRQFRIDFLGWILYMIAPIVAIILAIKGRESGLMLSVYVAGTTALYITLVPICYSMFRDFQDWIKYISWQTVVAAPAAAWGIWQYFNGFNNIEWSYALSGLSRVHTSQMLMEDPRIFGLFGSASALSCVGIYGCFAIWRAFRFKKHRYFYLFLGVLYLVTTVLSHQRTVLIYPLFIAIFALSFRWMWTTAALYTSAVTIFVVGIFNASFLLDEGIDQINTVISGEGRWSENVMMVSTFSDRLRGWERLTRADSWSLFGTGESLRSSILLESNRADYTADDYSHDIINKILINFGGVGLFVIIAISGTIIYLLHRVIFKSKDRQSRNDGAFVMACIIPTLILSFMGGDNFSATPVNLQIWSVFSGIFVLRKLLSNRSAASLTPPSPAIPAHQNSLLNNVGPLRGQHL